MKIDRLEPLPSQEHTFRVFLSDGTVVKTQDYVIADLGLFPGAELGEEQLREFLAAAGLASAKNRAVRIVSASAYSAPGTMGRVTFLLSSVAIFMAFRWMYPFSSDSFKSVP